MSPVLLVLKSAAQSASTYTVVLVGQLKSMLRLHVVHHHDRLHAGRRAVVATGISSTGRPGTLDRVATCARRVGHCISVSRSRSSQDAVVVVAHRDVARIARAQVCCAVRINVHRSVGWAAQGRRSGFMLSITMIVCMQVVVLSLPQASVALAVQVRSIV